MLKTKILSGLALISISASLFAASVDTAPIIKDYPKFFNNPAISVESAYNHGTFTEVSVLARGQQGQAPQKLNMYVMNDKSDVVFFGKAYHKDQVPYDVPKNEKLVKDGVLFSMGTGPEHLYLVTDPECPYCTRLDTSITDEALKKYTINVIPFPLSFHKNAKPMMYWVLSGKDNVEKNDRMHKVMSGDTTYKTFKVTDQEKLDKELGLANAAVIELGAQGTPSLFSSSMSKISPAILTEK